MAEEYTQEYVYSELGEFLHFERATSLLQDPIVDHTQVTVAEQTAELDEPFVWTRHLTLLLIELYREYQQKHGSEMKRKKKMWVDIAKRLGGGVTPSHCENRWKVLMRNYKGATDNNRKTGRAPKYYEYSEVLDPIFIKKKAIHPELLLTATSEVTPTTSTSPSTTDATSKASVVLSRAPHNRMPFPKTNEGKNATPSFTGLNKLSGPQQLDASESDDEENWENPSPTIVVKRKRGGQRSVLEKMREDKQKFFAEYLQIQRERVKLEERKVEEMKRKNDLRAKKHGLLIDVTNKNV